MKKIYKFISLFLAVTSMLMIFSNGIYATDEGYSWYIKRNGNSRPEIQPEQQIIYEYDGFYIDKKLSDNDKSRVIYLTFDLGYENGNAERILNTLKEENVPAAFFILDNIILKNPELIAKMLEDGHMICNHTKNHKNLSELASDEIIKNITDLEKIYEEKTGKQLDKYFRFPEGRYSEEALECVQSLGYKTIFWSFAYDDWDNAKQKNDKAALKKVLQNTHNGAVMLFHPTSKTNADIFPELIREWRKMGYTFGTLDELVS